jgi:maltooligosyltrehalose trehalohydrolase
MLFSVWAPRAETVELLLEDRRLPMQRGEYAYWRVDADLPRPETDYGYIVNGGKPLPDPRSPWQPNGVHGLSRTVDRSAFQWTDAHWQARPLSAALIYELHVGTFTPEGTFEAAVGKLDHLVDLGVTHVEIMPVADFPGERGWGYDGVSLFAPRQAYGGPLALKRLVNSCHEKGLGVFLDVVYNHLGPSGNYLGQFGPYFTDRHNTPWGPAVNFDSAGSYDVRRFFCDNALMWLRDYHFDGLRLDAVHAIIDNSAVHFLEQLATEVDSLKAHLGRHVVLIAESDLNDPRIVRPWEMGGFGIDAQWSDDFHHALHTVLTGEQSGYYIDFGSIGDLAKAIQQPFVYDGRYSYYRQRRHGRPSVGLSAHRFLGYLQNHDQLGNRARGDRSSHLMNLQRLKMGAAIVLMSPFVPMLFQGEEWGATTPFQYFVDFSDDPHLAEAVRKGRTEEFAAFGWRPEEIPNPQSRETFLRSKLNWSELACEQHAELLAWHKQLIQLRRELPGITDGRMDLVRACHDEQARWLVVEREGAALACNFADHVQSMPLRDQGYRLRLASDSAKLGDRQIELGPESIAVLAIE